MFDAVLDVSDVFKDHLTPPRTGAASTDALRELLPHRTDLLAPEFAGRSPPLLGLRDELVESGHAIVIPLPHKILRGKHFLRCEWHHRWVRR